MELIIGSHVSFNKNNQLKGSVMESLGYGSNTFMFYTGAPQNTNRSEIDKDITLEAHKLMLENNIDISNVIVHAPYIINLANNGDNYNFSINFLKEELKRVEMLGIKKLVLHPGSHVGLGIEMGLENIINALNIVLKDTSVIICLEIMAGKGNELGISFEQIKKIMDECIYKDKLMVCLDTCHMNDSGYDMSDFDTILNKIDEMIGIDKIGCIHINDSKNIMGAKKDRHENISLGSIGFDNMLKIIYHDKIKRVPKILETPYVTKTDSDKDRLYPPYKFEIDMIKNKKVNDSLIEDIRNYYK